MITAILLASGYSRRLHTDKLLLDFCGRPVIAHVMQTISSCRFDDRLLIQRDDRYTSYALAHGFTPYQNTSAVTGQSKSVHIGVKNTAAASALMFFVGDQPCLTPEVVNRLLQSHQEHPQHIIVPEVAGQFKNPVIFPARFRSDLLAVTGDRGGRTVIRKYPEAVQAVTFDDETAFLDIDTREDYHSLITAVKNK